MAVDNLGQPNGWGQPGDLWFPHVYEPNQDPLLQRAPPSTAGGTTAPGFGLLLQS